MNDSIMRMFFGITVAVVLVHAGPNRNAELFIDCAPKTAGIDSVGTCSKDSAVTIAIVLNGAHKVYDYQLFLVYDTAQLKFVSANKGNETCPNLLEANGGSIIFNSQKSINDSTRIRIGNSLISDDTAQCVSGSGCLALVTFKKRTIDTTRISLTKVLVEDCSSIADTSCPTHSAAITPATIAVRWNYVVRSQEKRWEYNHDQIKVYVSSANVNCQASILDITGRTTQRLNRTHEYMVAEMASASPGMYILSIVQDAHHTTYPFIVKK